MDLGGSTEAGNKVTVADEVHWCTTVPPFSFSLPGQAY